MGEGGEGGGGMGREGEGRRGEGEGGGRKGSPMGLQNLDSVSLSLRPSQAFLSPFPGLSGSFAVEG